MLDAEQNLEQRSAFHQALDQILAAGFHPRWIHAGSSATLLAQPPESECGLGRTAGRQEPAASRNCAVRICSCFFREGSEGRRRCAGPATTGAGVEDSNCVRADGGSQERPWGTTRLLSLRRRHAAGAVACRLCGWPESKIIQHNIVRWRLCADPRNAIPYRWPRVHGFDRRRYHSHTRTRRLATRL